jgi:putative SOS response-associated peptidase YedK
LPVCGHTRIGGEDILSTAIIVCGANQQVAPLHDRMPVILEPTDYDAWLDPAAPATEVHALLRPCPAEMLEAYPVSRIVGSPTNDVPECIEPIDDPV